MFSNYNQYVSRLYPICKNFFVCQISISKRAKTLLSNSQLFHQGEVLYNAYEKDIAIVNIFFGDSTVFGELLYQHSILCNNYFPQNLRGRQKWLCWTSYLALVASVDFALGSALFPLLRFFTGSLLSFAEISVRWNIIGDEGSTAPLTTYIAYSAYTISLLALFICLILLFYV